MELSYLRHAALPTQAAKMGDFHADLIAGHRLMTQQMAFSVGSQFPCKHRLFGPEICGASTDVEHVVLAVPERHQSALQRVFCSPECWTILTDGHEDTTPAKLEGLFLSRSLTRLTYMSRRMVHTQKLYTVAQSLVFEACPL